MFPVEDIEALVHGFYARVRQDPELAPVFDARIEDWGPHLDRMVAFWRSVLRAEAGFKPSAKGSPHHLHLLIEELRLEHFDRWLTLFAQTAERTLSPAAAREVMDRAARIGEALSGHLRLAPEGVA